MLLRAGEFSAATEPFANATVQEKRSRNAVQRVVEKGRMRTVRTSILTGSPATGAGPSLNPPIPRPMSMRRECLDDLGFDSGFPKY